MKDMARVSSGLIGRLVSKTNGFRRESWSVKGLGLELELEYCRSQTENVSHDIGEGDRVDLY